MHEAAHVDVVGRERREVLRERVQREAALLLVEREAVRRVAATEQVLIVLVMGVPAPVTRLAFEGGRMSKTNVCCTQVFWNYMCSTRSFLRSGVFHYRLPLLTPLGRVRGPGRWRYTMHPAPVVMNPTPAWLEYSYLHARAAPSHALAQFVLGAFWGACFCRCLRMFFVCFEGVRAF